ncbi:MAG: hypothetical protein JXR03_08845 [Cyclobacteriaceae bacterium]
MFTSKKIMLRAFLPPTNQHPLIQYIKQWEAFNNVDRRMTRNALLKIFASCVAVMVLAKFIDGGFY